MNESLSTRNKPPQDPGVSRRYHQDSQDFEKSHKVLGLPFVRTRKFLRPIVWLTVPQTRDGPDKDLFNHWVQSRTRSTPFCSVPPVRTTAYGD